jgi:hypothetical protein
MSLRSLRSKPQPVILSTPARPRRFGRLGIVWTLLTLLAVGYCGFMGLKDIGRTTKPIAEIELGDRTAGRNPLREQVTDEPEPAPETHRAVYFEMTKPSGNWVKFRLLWSLDDIEAAGAKPGATVYVEMPEMGVIGGARVVAVQPCPPIKNGNGNVVTGIFEHEPEDGLINVWVEGNKKPMGCTPHHLIWSEDRLDYVHANELKSGERVWSNVVGVLPVTGITNRPKNERVYNLQIHGEHIYEVTDFGVLVHNTCAGQHHFWPWSWGNKVRTGIPRFRI